MKIKLLALSLLSCANVWATETLNPGVTLLQHIETYGETLPQKYIDMPQTSSASATASANFSSGPHGSNIYASGYVTATMRNASSSSQIYYVDRYMCIENTNCTHSRDSYQLNPNTSQSTNSNVSITAYMATKGTFQDEAIINITGYETNSAKGTNSVVVT